MDGQSQKWTSTCCNRWWNLILPKTVQLSRHFGVSPQTICGHLRELGKVRKLEKWVPYLLSPAQKEMRMMTSLCYLIRNKNESILDRILSCDEKWILYDNRKRKRLWLDKGQAPQQIPKPEINQRKIMVTVWWISRCFVHYDFLPPGKTINADYYCQELATDPSVEDFRAGTKNPTGLESTIQWRLWDGLHRHLHFLAIMH
ncbi:hypothetical protein RvY_11342 [Ramazzottius varieornatus]|uniref:Uncharacterized protein n=1 Tax=Ramazzottius varieornatus TaxID=947166 RepID=A0A1D1VK59_RAMVA|nr:hypothetical protein RvY_11342 [Ramazzottius varieornatus]